MPRREVPLDESGGVLVEFAAGLRRLREKAGGLGYRELARRAHFSPSTLSSAAGGKRLPSLEVTLAYVRACGGDAEDWERRWRATAEELDPRALPAAVEGQAPYVGLVAYGSADAEWFCGRERVVAALTDRVRRQRFVAVVGASGAGKSSVLRAGLLPAVSSTGTLTMVVTPGTRPLEECAVRLGAELGIPAGQLAAEFREHPRDLGLAIRQLLATRQDRGEFLLVVDQFEEIFTLCRDERERESFVAALLAAAGGPESRTRVVVGLRADFYAHCVRHPRLVEALQDAQVLVGPMSTDELTEAVVQPAVRAGLMVDKALVATVVHDAAERPGALPFVSHALWETWRRRRGNGLFLAEYRAAGGVNGAIAQTADRVYHDLDERQQRTARGIFLRLTALGEGTEDTRRRVARDELLDSPARETVAEVLSRLAAARLVTLDLDTVEIAHEALIRSWPTLQSWLNEDREAVLAHRRLTEAAAEWERHGRDEGLLYRGARLAGWQDRSLERLNDAERAFLTAGRRAEERELRLRRRRVRLTIGGLGTATAVVAVLALLALVMAARAEKERAVAVGRQLAADARAQLQLDPELGLLLAREAYATAPNDETEAVLRQAATDSHIRATLRGHGDQVTGVTFSPDGRNLVTSGLDGALRVWDWHAERGVRTTSRVLYGNSALAWSPVFSADSSRVAAMGADGVVSVWDWARDLDGRTEPVQLKHGESQLYWRVRIALGPDGRRVASGSEDGAVRLWDLATGSTQPMLLRGHSGWVYGVAFSPDGRSLASGGEDGTVRVWDLAGGGEPVVLRGHHTSVESVAWSPDGTRLVTAGTDGTIRVWDPKGVADAVVLGSHDAAAYGVAYSADGHSIASTGIGGVVRVWNAQHLASPAVLRGHRGLVWSAAFSPDGRSVASVGDDGTAKVWDVDEVEDTTVLRGHEGAVLTVAPSPDGRRVASSGDDGTIRVWDLTGREDPVVLSTRGRRLLQVTFSPDGRRLAAVDDHGTVIVWRTRDLTEPVLLRATDGPVHQVAFSPDGERLAAVTPGGNLWVWSTNGAGPFDRYPAGSASDTLPYVAWSPDGQHIAASVDDHVLLWDFRVSIEPIMLPGDPSRIRTLAFSPDGTRLAGGDDDGTVHLWTVGGTAAPVALRGHEGVVWSAAFSTDGRFLATTGIDTTIRLWKTGDTSDPLTLNGFRAPVHTVAPLGADRYVTAHDDGTVRVWRCRTCGPVTEVLDRASRHVTRTLTAQERSAYLS
jgi:WD40 repeat protein